MKKIIGLDISMRATGVAVVEDGYHLLHQEVLETTKIHTNCELDCILRAHQQAIRICEIIAQEQPDVCVIEAPAYNALIPVKGKFGTTMRLASSVCQLWQLTGAIKHEVMRVWHGPIEVLSPSAVKKYITGNGRAEKHEMLQTVAREYGLSFTDHNICDAFCLCVCYLDGRTQLDIRQKGRSYARSKS